VQRTRATLRVPGHYKKRHRHSGSGKNKEWRASQRTDPKSGDLKTLYDTAKAFEIPKQGNDMMTNDDSKAREVEQLNAKDSNE